VAVDNSQSKESDLDRTDKLPILQGVFIDEDVEDDAVRMDYSTTLPASPVIASQLADSVRSVEERIARQNAEYDALSRLYEKARDDMDRAVNEKNAASEAARTRIDEALRESERHQSESRILRDSLAARDATIVQVLHSLGERDAQLHALQREHAQTVPVLEARSQVSAQLTIELEAARGRTESTALELQKTQQDAAALTAQLKRGESELSVMRQELGTMASQAGSYLEILRTREWRRGFDHVMFLDWDAKMDADRAGQGAVQTERDQLKQTTAALSAKLIEQEEIIAKLESTVAADAAALGKKAEELQESQRIRTEFAARVEALEAERNQLRSEIAARDVTLAEGRAQAAQIAELESEAETHEQEMTVLMAHLNEARRPIQSIQDDVKRLSDDLALKTLSLEQLNEDNRTLRSALERTRGALEEREFSIRRLERSESNNANALGRIQTSIERLGSTPATPGAPPLSAEFAAEFIRIDGERNVTHTLARRTRIGRAQGCELQIDSSSVSRHHALLLKGARELIIEDLNSTNGVIVNGRKVSRQLLSDGDLVTIGEIQFRCVLKPTSAAAPAANPAGTHPGEPVKVEGGSGEAGAQAPDA
jgi:FHA domain